MAIVGINFGSATGGTGFDVTATVSSIVDNLKAVELPWTTQLSALKAQDTALSSLGTDLSTLSSSLEALTDFQGVMASKLGSSSNSDVVSLTSAGPTAVAGSHTVIVAQIAQTSSASLDVVPASDTLTGALTFKVGTGDPVTIPAVSGTSDTLATYAAAINLADIGVAASIVTDNSGSRLSFVSSTSGVAGQLTITSGGTAPATSSDGSTTPATTYTSLTDTTTGVTVGIQAGLDGQDAKLSVDGLSITSSTNTISSAIRGVTFQVLAASPSSKIQVQIVNDTSSVSSTFSALVTAYNAVVKDIATQEGNDSSGNPEPLFGNSVISRLQSSLSMALTSTSSSSGSIASLYDLGVSVNQDGTLTLDSTTLSSKLNSNYSDVVSYLQGSGSFGSTFTSTLEQLGNANTTGMIALALAANTSQETTLNEDVTKEDAYIASQKSLLTNQLNAANEILQSIPQQLNQVNELYNALTGYTAKG